MSYLSQRAEQYLSKQERNCKFIFTEDEVVEFFMVNEIDFSDAIFDAQTRYSGYTFSIIEERGEDFSFFLLHSLKTKLDCEIEDGQLYLPIHYAHRTAQFSFYISSKGEIVTLGFETDNKIILVYKSVESLIEDYAFRNELSKQGFQNGAYYRVDNKDTILKYLKLNFEEIDSNTDRLHLYFRTGSSIIHITHAIDTGLPLLTIYEKNKSSQGKDLLIKLDQFLKKERY